MEVPWKRGLQIAVTAVAVVFILRVADPARVAGVLTRVQPAWLLAAIGLWAGIQALAILKWQAANALQGVHASLAVTARAHLVGMFFNTFLPSSFGGDAVRAYQLARRSGRTAGSVGSVIVDRFLSLHALLVAAGGAVLGLPALRQAVSMPTLVAVSLAGTAPFFMPLLLTRSPLSRLVGRLPGLASVLEAFVAPGAARRTGTLYLMALVMQVLNALMHVWICRSLGLDVPAAYVMGFVPVMVLIGSLPVSVNGLGLREGALVYFLGRAGVPAAEALAVGFLSLLMLLLAGAVGAWVYWTDREPAADGPPAPAPPPRPPSDREATSRNS
ncbi:MAG: lysylphosphatidylglycerol synthase transmembrane domain-containing protein [bacterium]|nr:lysylphosphatidylglycerol synthase transmembrane domain-containing protein [bacterium]